jgi:transcription antitermination factor NusG
MGSARSLCLVVGARSLDEVAADYVPGDVVHFPEGPFQGVCAVVREVDSVASRLQVDALVKGGPYELSIGFDEVEWA